PWCRPNGPAGWQPTNRPRDSAALEAANSKRCARPTSLSLLLSLLPCEIWARGWSRGYELTLSGLGRGRAWRWTWLILSNLETSKPGQKKLLQKILRHINQHQGDHPES